MLRLSSWLSSLRRSLRPAPRRRCRPGVEPLEGREVPAVFTVTTALDAGPGSLRAAIQAANAHPNVNGVADQIRFNISGPAHIVPLSALPEVTQAVVIDGTTQPGSGGQPAVELDGSVVAGAGLVLRNHAGSTVKGLVINGFGGDGIVLAAGGRHTITDNFIGTTADGQGDLGNGGDGVLINQSHNNTVSGNLVSGNAANGVEVVGGLAADNVISGNMVGTNRNGTLPLRNEKDGVHIEGALRTVVNGGNILSGNGDDGVEVHGGSGTRVGNNRIGTSVSGLSPLGNRFGVFLSGARNSLVRNNVISDNTFEGVLIGDGAAGNAIQGNIIGLAIDGVTPLGNHFDGIEVLDARNNVIGGPTPGQRNLIAANLGLGVLIANASATGNVVQGNFIGTDATGTLDRGNAGEGVKISNRATGNSVLGNVISGNGKDGVAVADAGTAGNAVRGNKIGTDVTGRVALANDGDGVDISGGAGGNVIGGQNAASRNVISGNREGGVSVDESNANVIRGNFIGVSATGLAALDNENDTALSLIDSSNNLILGNVVSSLRFDDVLIGGVTPGANHNQVRGNFLGVGVDGKTPLGSRGGVSIDGGSHNLIVGNVIAHHSDEGVSISSTTDAGNTITRNSIFANGEFDIDNGRFGIDGNDPLDVDAGPNGGQNSPVITTVVSSPGRTVINGVLGSSAKTTFRVEFFAGAGRTFVGSALVTTGADGNGTFHFVLNKSLAAGNPIVATATNLATGDTSEYCAARAVKGVGGVVKGVVFNDRNGDGTRQAGEGGMKGIVVFADLDGDGQRNKAEPAAVTAANGFFQLFLAQDATSAVREATPKGFTRTTPVRVVSVAGNTTVGGVVIGNRLVT